MAAQVSLFLIVFFGLSTMMGLPGQAFGVAWPSVRETFGLPLDYAGIVAAFGSVLSIISNASSGWFLKRFSLRRILIASCFMLAAGSTCYAYSVNFFMYLLGSLPVGLACGLISATINTYMSQHCSPRHMSWFHGFWGVGATGGSFLMSLAVNAGRWRAGYLAIAGLQLLFAAFSAARLPVMEIVPEQEEKEQKVKIRFDAKKVTVLAVFFFYNCVEASVGVFFYSYLVEYRSFATETAGLCIVLYWSFLTVGRFIIGLISVRIGYLTLLKTGMLGGAVLLGALGHAPAYAMLPGLAVLGFLLAGTSPSLMYATPRLFGRREAVSFVGYQGAAGSFGVVTLLPAVGFILRETSLAVLPYLLCGIMGVVTTISFCIYSNRLEKGAYA